MYSRYTAFSFEETDKEKVVDFWENTGIPFVAQKPGFRGNYIAFSEDNPGKLKTFTLWDTKEDFERLFSSKDHENMIKALKETGMEINDRDGLNVFNDSRPSVGTLRVIKVRLKPDKSDDAVHFWKSIGKPLISSQPGCIRAEAFKEPKTDSLVVSILWTSPSDADRFLETEEHKEFAAGMDENVLEIVEKQSLEMI